MIQIEFGFLIQSLNLLEMHENPRQSATYYGLLSKKKVRPGSRVYWNNKRTESK